MPALFAWLGAATQHAGVSFTTLLEAGVNLVPPALVDLGHWGAGIRDTAAGTSIVVYAILAWSLLLVIVGGIGAVNHWVLDTSVFHQMASAPAVPPHWEANGIMTAIGVRGARWRSSVQAPGPAGRMTSFRDDPSTSGRIPMDERPVAFEDLTARARIRESALKHFAQEGYEGATIRAIAQTAGVSPGLFRHHYGSKDALRVACDGHVFEMLHRLNAQVMENPGAAARSAVSRRFGRYVAVPGRRISDRWADLRRNGCDDRSVARPGRSAREDMPAIDRSIRAALVTAMKVGIPLLHDHVSRALGMDMFGPEGEQLVALALLDIYSHD